MVSTSALTWARALTSASRAGESSAPSFAVTVLWANVLIAAAEPASVCSTPGGVKDAGRRRHVVRKPVVLITGASGEIGHGLIESLARDGRRPIITLDLKPLEPPQAALVQQQYAGSILDDHLLERILAEYEVDLVFHLAALLSTRGEFTPTTAHQVNVEGMIRMLEFAQKEGESHGRPVTFLYPSSIAAYGLPDLATKAARGPGRARTLWNVPDHDVRLQQALLRAPRAATTRGTTSSSPPRRSPARWTSARVRFPGLISGDDRALGRHLRLRARDAARGGPGQALRLLRPARHAHPVHGHARRRRGARSRWRRRRKRVAHAHGLQRRRLQPVGRGGPRARGRGLPGRRHHATRPTSSGSRSSTPGRPTSTTPRRAATGASPRATTRPAPSPST